MIHRDAFGRLALAGIVSAACGVFGWIGLVSPEWLGWPSANPLAVKMMLVVLGSMPLLWLLAFRLHLRSLWIYRNTKPVAMYLQIRLEEDSQGTSYYALLRSTPEGEQIQEVPVYPPRWDLQLVGSSTPARVFVDPASAKPMVIEIDGRRLWAMAL